MNKKITILTAALALLTILAVPIGMWGQTRVDPTATFTPSNFSGQGTSGTGSAISATVDGVTFACDKGYGTTQIRCYKDGKITISSSNTITGISFTFSGSYTGGLETSYTNLSTTSWEQTLGSQARITECVVTYSGGGSTTPSIAAENVNLNADDTNGQISYTVNNPVEGGSISAVITDGDWISNVNVVSAENKVTFDAEENTGAQRTGTVRLTYTYTAKESVTKDVTITQGAPSFHVTYDANGATSGTVPTDETGYESGTQVRVKANTGDLAKTDYYWTGWNTAADGSGTAYTSYDKFNITSNVTLYAQWTTTYAKYTVSTTSAVTTSGDAPNSSSATFTQTYETACQMTNGNSMTLTLSGYQNHIIKGIVLSMKSNSSGGKGYMSAVAGGSTTIASFGSSESDKTFNGDWYTGWSTSYVDIPITLSDYNYVVKNEDIVITINATANSLYCQSFTILYELTTTPVINASDVEIAASETSGEIAYTISNPDGSTLAAAEKAPGYDWIDAVTVVDAENKVTFTTTANAGASRVGYITLTYGSVTKDVKVTQAAPVYTVTCATELENGSIEASPTTAAEGETITINATPIDSDVYALISVTVTKASDSSPVSVVKTGNTATFTMPADNVNVTATFGPIPDYVDLPFNWAGGTKAELNAQNGVTVTADNSDYAESNAPYRIKFNTDGHNIVIKTNEPIGAVSVGIKKFATGNASILKIEGSVNGTTYSEIQQFTISGAQNATFKYYTTAAFDADYRYVRIYFNKPDSDGSNIGVGPIVVRSIESFSLSIGGYGDNDNVKTGWNLIASPIVSTTPVGVTNMLSNNYDLYRFNQSAEKEWENYKASNFSIASGQGYLYANSEDVELTFTGIPYLGDGNVTLTKVDGKEFSGFNLIGNPYNANATVDKDYYRMNEYGSEIVTGSGPVAAMEGIFVIATNDGETVTFTQSVSSPAPSNQLVMNLSYNTRGSAIDRAIVRFGEGNQLPKFQLFENSTKVYIPQGGKDYAIVRSEAQGELPINFKAEKNGSYTLSIDIDADMDYLHLIDNMTGADVDLLQTPSYTFDARTSDYASRFRLMFSINNVPENEDSHSAFAYFNGSEWVINASDNATVQVVDVMGRVILNADAKHGVSTANMPAGVYMLRLVNGNNVKVQKIVVR